MYGVCCEFVLDYLGHEVYQGGYERTGFHVKNHLDYPVHYFGADGILCGRDYSRNYHCVDFLGVTTT